MRKLSYLLLLVTILLTSCTARGEDVQKQEKKKPVKVSVVNEEVMPVKLEYIGTVLSDQMKKVSFKSSGKVLGIDVKKGQIIKAGDVLARLDTVDLEFSLRASEAQVRAADAQYKKALNGAQQEDINKAQQNMSKAKAAYDFAKQNYGNIEKLYSQEAISKIEFDKSKLELDIRQSELSQAEEVYRQLVNGARQEDKNMLLSQLEQAKTDYEYKKTLVNEAVLKADVDGFVVDVLFKEGEMVSAGYPVVVIRNSGQVVKVGLTQDDYAKVKLGMKVLVRVRDTDIEGIVTNIEQVPDNQTRTYTVEISIPESQLQIGAIVKTGFIIGEEKGMTIPVSSIISSGEDCVYVVGEDGIALKKKVELGEVKGSTVMVKGLAGGDKLVVEGMKKLNDGDKVNIQ